LHFKKKPRTGCIPSEDSDSQAAGDRELSV
jgi:hypothetical protein